MLDSMWFKKVLLGDRWEVSVYISPEGHMQYCWEIGGKFLYIYLLRVTVLLGDRCEISVYISPEDHSIAGKSVGSLSPEGRSIAARSVGSFCIYISRGSQYCWKIGGKFLCIYLLRVSVLLGDRREVSVYISPEGHRFGSISEVCINYAPLKPKVALPSSPLELSTFCLQLYLRTPICLNQLALHGQTIALETANKLW